ncbi:hypothetical protein D3C85_1736790 [compost metagenome]
MTATNAISFEHQFHIVSKFFAVQGDRVTALKAYRHFFCLDFDVFIPELHAHDRVHDLHAGVQELQIFRFVGCTQHVGVGGVGFFN